MNLGKRAWFRVAMVAAVSLLCAAAWASCALRTSPQRDRGYFEAHAADYQRLALDAIERVRSLDVQPTETFLQLDSKDSHLSDGGEIYVWRPVEGTFLVTFWRARGLLGQGREYVYCPSDEGVTVYLEPESDSIEPLGDGWFYVVNH